MTAQVFTEYLHLAIRGADGEWIRNELEAEVAYWYSPAEGDGFGGERFPEAVSILSVRCECADDVLDFLPAMSEAQVSDLKRTALSYEVEAIHG